MAHRLRMLVATVACLTLTAGGYPGAVAVAAPPQTGTCPIVGPPANTPAPPPPPDYQRTTPVSQRDPLTQPGLVTPATAPAVPDQLSAHSWVVADLDSGEILAACDAHARYRPASVIKLLTALTVAPKLDPNSTTTVTEQDLDFEPGSSAVGLVKGGTYSVATLLLGLFLNSGNDAAQVLARLGGGDKGMAGTIDDMNKTAHKLGANDTMAATPHGLDADGQLTSAFDLAVIAAAVMRQPELASYLATQTASMPPQGSTPGYQIQNDNQLLYDYDGALGGKTGFTDAARHTYVGMAARGGRRLVVTMMYGERYPTGLWRQAATLMDWGFGLETGTSVGTINKTSAASASTSSDNKLQASVHGPGFADRISSSLLLIGGAATLAAIGGIAGLRSRQRPAHTPPVPDRSSQ